jgi:heptosyltransferase-2
LASVKKILVIRFSSIGDCIWVTPVLRCLKEQLPCELHFATKKAYQELFECNPHIDKLQLLDENGLNNLIARLKTERYDYIIDLHKNLRTLWIKVNLCGVKSFSYPKLTFQKWQYVALRKKDALPNNHVADRYLQTVLPLGVNPDNKGLELIIPERSVITKEYFPLSHQNGFVAFVIGASYYTKRLPLGKLIEFCENIQKPVVLVGGKEDIEIANQIEDYFAEKRPNFILNLCGKLNLGQSASVVSQAMYLYGHDTGLTHIAACFQKKIYAIFGGTTPELGLYPYRTPYEIIENKDLDCRPCSRLGKKACPKGHFNCMMTLSNEKIEKNRSLT